MQRRPGVAKRASDDQKDAERLRGRRVARRAPIAKIMRLRPRRRRVTGGRQVAEREPVGQGALIAKMARRSKEGAG